MASAVSIVDAAIIGAGPAGLSVATSMARQLHSAVVFDSGVYRNRLTHHMHNVAGWDHKDPAAFRSAARSDILARYNTIQFQDSTCIAKINIAAKEPGSGDQVFELTDDKGTVWSARKVVLANGVQDIFPDIDGYEDCWARGIFHCLFCHGYEERGGPSAGVLAVEAVASPMLSMHIARMALRLSEKVTIYTNGNDELATELQAKAEGTGIDIDARRISRLEKVHQSYVILHLEGPSETKTEGFLAHAPRTKVNGPFAEQLGLELLETGEIKTSSPFYETSVNGIFAAGDLATPMKSVTQAIAMGTFVAAGLCAQVQAEDMARRAASSAHGIAKDSAVV
ncbi:unnamed protein product [Discula destructiva]